MEYKALIMTDLVLRRVRTLQENPEVGETQAWTIKRASAEIRQMIGVQLFSFVDELTPELSPTRSMSLEEYYTACRRLLMREAQVVHQRETISMGVHKTADQSPLDVDVSSNEVPREPWELEITLDSAVAPTEEFPVRQRSWSEFWDDAKRTWNRFWNPQKRQ